MFGLGTIEIIILAVLSTACLGVLGLVALAYIAANRMDRHDPK